MRVSLLRVRHWVQAASSIMMVLTSKEMWMTTVQEEREYMNQAKLNLKESGRIHSQVLESLHSKTALPSTWRSVTVGQ